MVTTQLGNMVYHSEQNVSHKDPVVRKKWQNIDEAALSLCMWLAQGYDRQTLKKGDD